MKTVDVRLFDHESRKVVHTLPPLPLARGWRRQGVELAYEWARWHGQAAGVYDQHGRVFTHHTLWAKASQGVHHVRFN